MGNKITSDPLVELSRELQDFAQKYTPEAQRAALSDVHVSHQAFEEFINRHSQQQSPDEVSFLSGFFYGMQWKRDKDKFMNQLGRKPNDDKES